MIKSANGLAALRRSKLRSLRNGFTALIFCLLFDQAKKQERKQIGVQMFNHASKRFIALGISSFT